MEGYDLKWFADEKILQQCNYDSENVFTFFMLILAMYAPLTAANTFTISFADGSETKHQIILN
jgi:hypothetical protein